MNGLGCMAPILAKILRWGQCPAGFFRNGWRARSRAYSGGSHGNIAIADRFRRLPCHIPSWKGRLLP